jgi:hypothetical protein
MEAKEGLELAMEIGCERVILEIDCSILKSLLENSDGMRSSIGGICFDIIELAWSFVDLELHGLVGMLTQWHTAVHVWCRPLSMPFVG